MIDLTALTEKFNITCEAGKLVCVDNIVEVLDFVKNNSQYSLDMLLSITAVDLNDKIELIYDLYSTLTDKNLKISVYVRDNLSQSVVSVYKSAYFDECEIYDLFGVSFEGNKNLKRLLMPESWSGHPMLKSYKQNDERLCWNEN